ncbi:transposase [Microtetraspora sp. NBRC 16547]|uniref:transposase n=1 Tax=Microtetraspora sp. NBRC 16547 TaxID=3030993 RepID=UPI0025523389|nr:transposase [Microtetraspora sp. NBRC 16547]
MTYVAIDMCTIFKAAVRAALPHAVLVVDHFHLVQLANATVTEVRRRVTVQVRSRRGREGNREWELRNRLRFYDRCAASGLPELERLATTVQTWWPEICAFIRTGITNAGPEGTNRVIKTIGRDAYGFRNPENQRLRTRCATARKSRGSLNSA